MPRKELKEIFEKLAAQGWRIEQGARHYKAFPPDPSKPFVTISSTPSGSRWLQNLVAQLKRSGADL